MPVMLDLWVQLAIHWTKRTRTRFPYLLPSESTMLLSNLVLNSQVSAKQQCQLSRRVYGKERLGIFTTITVKPSISRSQILRSSWKHRTHQKLHKPETKPCSQWRCRSSKWSPIAFNMPTYAIVNYQSKEINPTKPPSTLKWALTSRATI